MSIKTSDPGVLADYVRLREEEVQACKDRGGWCADPEAPYHFVGHTINNGILVIDETCESRGRRFDIETRTFIGNSHCTCDVCF